MTLQPTPSRTVTPMPGSYQSGGCDVNGDPLAWVAKLPSATDDFWLDASLEVADSGASVFMFSFDVYYGDGALVVKRQIVDGNVCGLLLSAGTPGIFYAVRILATLTDDRVLSWNVALPMFNEAAGTVYNNIVGTNGAALSYAGRLLPGSTGG